MCLVQEANGSISIHALREEGDSWLDKEKNPDADFYPRPPRGGRLRRCDHDFVHHPISIHALREEGDHNGLCRPSPSGEFLSTPSARRAT